MIASLFGSNTSAALPPSVLASYIHNGCKIYSSWLTSLAIDWSESDLDQIRSVTAALQDRLITCAKSDDVELQERAAELGQLLDLVTRGLDAPRPLPPVEEGSAGGFGGVQYDGNGDAQDFAGTDGAAALPPPSCLELLAPLFTCHELNPVNSKAQSMVAVPQGLNLDLVIIPRARSNQIQVGEQLEVDDYGRPKRVVVAPRAEEPVKRIKGKAGGKKVKGSSRRVDVEEDSEELARVSFRIGAAPFFF